MARKPKPKMAWLCEQWGCLAHDHTRLKASLEAAGRAGETEHICADCNALWVLQPIQVSAGSVLDGEKE